MSPLIQAVLAACVPSALAASLVVLFWFPSLRPAGLALLGEHGPIELLTFVALLVGGVGAIAVARAHARSMGSRWVVVFFGAMAVGLLMTAMEEIAWGQWLLGFRTPAAFESNVQGETTLHNLKGMHGHTEYLRVAFGLGGLAGVWLGRWRSWAPVAPPPTLWSWFAVIFALAAVDLIADYRTLGSRPNRVIDDMAEAVEMMIGITAVLYVWSAFRGRPAPRSAPAAPAV